MNREQRLNTLMQSAHEDLWDEDPDVEKKVLPDGTEIEYQKGFPPFALTRALNPDDLQQDLRIYILKMNAIFAAQVLAILAYVWHLNNLTTDKQLVNFATSNISFGVSVAAYIGTSGFLAAQISMQYGRVLPVQFLLYLGQTLALGYIVGYAGVRGGQVLFAQNLLVIIFGCAMVLALLRNALAQDQIWTSSNKIFGIGIMCLIAGLAKLLTLEQSLEQFFTLASIGMVIFLYMVYDTYLIINGKWWCEDVSKFDVFFGASKLSFDLLVLSFVMLLVTLVMAMLCQNDSDVDMDDGFARVSNVETQGSHVDGQHFWEFGGQSQLGQSMYSQGGGGGQNSLSKSTLGFQHMKDEENEDTIQSAKNNTSEMQKGSQKYLNF